MCTGLSLLLVLIVVFLVVRDRSKQKVTTADQPEWIDVRSNRGISWNEVEDVPQKNVQLFVYLTPTTHLGTITQERASPIRSTIQRTTRYRGMTHTRLQTTPPRRPLYMLHWQMMTPLMSSMLPITMTTIKRHHPYHQQQQQQQQSHTIHIPHPPANLTSAHLQPQTPTDYAAYPVTPLVN